MKPNYIQQRAVGESTILQQSFAWMFVGLLLTAGSAVFAASNMPFRQALRDNSILFIGLIIVELVLVFAISASVTSLAAPVAMLLFAAYALINGLTLSVIFFVYASGSIAAAFVSSALIFGIMACFGYATKKDLSGVGSIAFMALIGLIIASLVNMFLHSASMGYLLSYGAVIIFTALTAYDTQKLKMLSSTMGGGNLGIYGALTLYLDFINIFLALLRIFGRQRN
ncbi:MAG TPA: Bax inhibitor-1/YccA family protein [Fimbriimonas sp.]|nr:Bax inhibitor-1/YccA family protein [Fimbriimonas sp.]